MRIVLGGFDGARSMVCGGLGAALCRAGRVLCGRG